jgi:hypothetical protein
VSASRSDGVLQVWSNRVLSEARPNGHSCHEAQGQLTSFCSGSADASFIRARITRFLKGSKLDCRTIVDGRDELSESSQAGWGAEGRAVKRLQSLPFKAAVVAGEELGGAEKTERVEMTNQRRTDRPQLIRRGRGQRSSKQFRGLARIRGGWPDVQIGNSVSRRLSALKKTTRLLGRSGIASTSSSSLRPCD